MEFLIIQTILIVEMNPVLVFGLFVVSCFAALSPGNQYVEQMNAGIYFEQLGVVKTYDTTWKLIVEISLKDLDQKIDLIYKLAMEIENNCKKNSLEKTHFPAACQTIRTIGPEFVRKIKVERYNINEYLKIRNRRGAIDGLGTIFKQIAGTMDAEDFKNINEALENSKNKVDKMKDLMKSQIQTLKIESDVLNTTIGNVNYNRDLIRKQTIKINEIIAVLKPGGFQNEHLELKGLMEGQLELFTLMSTLLLDEIEEIRNTIKDAKKNVLNTSIISYGKLLEKLVEALPYLKDDVKFPIKLDFDNIEKLDNVMEMHVFAVESHDLKIILEIPVVKHEKFELYKLFAIPESVGKNSFAMLNVNEEFFAINKAKTVSLEIDEKHLKKCQRIDTDFICSDKVSKKRVGTSRSCTVDIFTQRNNTHPESCGVTVFSLDEPKIVELEDSSAILVICPKPEMAELNCENSTEWFELKNTSLVRVNNSCSFHVGNTEMNFKRKEIQNIQIKYRQVVLEKVNLENINTDKFVIEKLPGIVKPMDLKNIGYNLENLDKGMVELDNMFGPVTRHPNIIGINILVFIVLIYWSIRKIMKCKRNQRTRRNVQVLRDLRDKIKIQESQLAGNEDVST